MTGSKKKDFKTAAIFLSGGIGSRAGSDIPKQYVDCGGKKLFSYALETLLAHPMIDEVWVAADPAWRTEFDGFPVTGFSLPGETRQGSIRNAARDIDAAHGTDGKKWAVLIHDAARPYLTPALITGTLEALKGHEGVLPVLPATDTLYRCDEKGRIRGLLNRDEIFAGQAPEAFLLAPYLQAMDALSPDRFTLIRGSSEPAVLAGMDVVTIPGDPGNRKITTAEDLNRFRQEEQK